MAQGGVKGLKTKGGQSTGGAKKNLGKTRKGKFMVPPKDKQRIAQASAHKQLSSKITGSLEKQMISAASSGKLTIMRNEGDLEAGAGKKAKGK